MIKFYKTYFQRLATQHIDIKHVANSRRDEAFFYVKDKYNPGAFDTAIKAAGKTPALLLERFTYDLDSNGNKNCFRHINGRFTIVVNTVAGDEQSIEAAEQLAEKIILSIIAKMEQDFGSGTGSITLDDGESQRVIYTTEQVPVDPVGPMLQKYYGATVGFKWRCPFKGAVNPSDWLDNS